MASSELDDLSFKTVIVTGGANGIGARAVHHYSQCGANVAIADLSSAEEAATKLIASLRYSEKAIFIPTNIVQWSSVSALFTTTLDRFGRVDIVVANAGIMESRGFFDFSLDDDGALQEATDSARVIDVNLKGTMNSTTPPAV